MNRNKRIDNHVTAIAKEVYDYMLENSDRFEEGWIPIELVRSELGLEIFGCPKNTDMLSAPAWSSKRWMFGIVARRLEDLDLIEYDKTKEKSLFRIKYS